MILVVVELDESGITPVSFELLGIGRKLSGEAGEELGAAVLGYGVEPMAEELASYAEKVYVVQDPKLREFDSEVRAEALEKLCRRVDPSVLVLPHTTRGMDVAPRLAHRLGVLLTTDCIHLSFLRDRGVLLRSKPIYGGNVIATLEISGRPQLVTVRPKAFEPAQPASRKGEVVYFELSLEAIPTFELIRRTREEARLTDAEAIVAGGRGMGGVKGFERLTELARVLERFFGKVAIGASRPPCDAGWVPKSFQVGLTGEKVSPKLYIAVAISGSVQHLAGISKAGKIVAINRDPKANIFKASDYGVVGEYEKVLPAFIQKLRELA